MAVCPNASAEIQKLVNDKMVRDKVSETEAVELLIKETEVLKKVDILQARANLRNQREFNAWIFEDNTVKVMEKHNMTNDEAYQHWVRGTMVRDATNFTNSVDVETMTKSLTQRFASQIGDVLDVLSTGGKETKMKLWGDIHLELDGIDTGNPLAKSGSKRIVDMFADIRKLANEYGANLGDIGDYLPQSVSRSKLTAAGREVLKKDIMSRLDLKRSFKGVHPDEVDRILNEIFDQRVTPTKGKALSAKTVEVLAEKNDHKRRVLHYKSHKMQMEMESKYGEYGDNISDQLLASIESSVRDLANIKRYGPDPQTWFDAEVAAGRVQRAFNKEIAQGAIATPSLNDLWNHTSGKADRVDPYFQKNAEKNTAVREYVSAALLGSSTPTAIFGDIASLMWRSGINDTGFFRWLGEMTNKMDTNELQQIGVEISKWNELSSASAKYGDFGTTATTSNVLLTKTLKYNGMAPWTEWARGASVRSISSRLASEAGKPLGELSSGLKRVLSGVSEDEWKELSKHLVEINGNKYIDLDAVFAKDLDLGVKYHGALIKESEAAIVQSTLKTKATIRRKNVKGSFYGELGSHLFHLKSTPLELWRNFMGLQQQLSGLERSTAIGKAVMMSFMAGYLIDQSKRVLVGKEPIDLTSLDAEQWLKLAPQWFSRGSMIGLFGDIGVTSVLEDRGIKNTLVEQVTPPSLSEAGRFADKLLSDEWIEEPGSAWHDLSRFGVKYVPFANNILLKGLVERSIIDEMGEMFDPNFNKKVKRKIKRLNKDSNTGYFVPPGDLF